MTTTTKFIRLNKYIANAGVCSRRQADIYIAGGQVKVNDQVVRELGTKIDPSDPDCRVMIRGKVVGTRTTPHIYVMLHKPAGYIVTMTKRYGERTVLDLLPSSLGTVKPVGRLDKSSTGLLLLSSDGEYIQRLTHPSFQHEKEYIVTIKEVLSDQDLRKLSQGIKLEEGNTGQVPVQRIDTNSFSIILKQGWNRQIRRMVKTLDKHVTKLRRIRIGNITLGNLPVGKWQPIPKHLLA